MQGCRNKGGQTDFVRSFILSIPLKFGLSEKHSKFEKNLPRGFDKSADLLAFRIFNLPLTKCNK
jgi:hypothetical protein